MTASRRSSLACACAALAAAAALSACGSAENGGSADKTRVNAELATPLQCTKSPTAQELLAYQVPKATKRYKIAWLQPSLQGYYFQAMAYGARRAAREAGVELMLVGGQGYTDPSAQLTDAENVLNRGADAVVLAPVDYQGSVPVVDRAVAAGLPVINVSTEVKSDKAYKVLQDDYVQGETSARALVAALPRGGAGIIMGGPANATWSRRRVLGFEHELAKHPEFSVATVTNGDIDPSAGLADFENAVQAHPDPAWIYSVNVYLLLPDAIPARYRDVPYVTAGYEPVVAAGLSSGRLDASVTNVPVEMGLMGVGAAVAALDGDAPKTGLTCLPNTPLTKADIGSPVANAELLPADAVKAGG